MVGPPRAGSELRRKDLLDDPIAQFSAWYAEAERNASMPERMALATVDASGRPDVRMVLLKGFDRRGLRFFTSYGSSKAGHLEATPAAAVVFHWPELDRQVRVRGTVERLSPEESDEYFATRDRLSRLGAWASSQSRTLSGRDELESALAEVIERFGGFDAGGEIPRPDGWGGYLIRPFELELWQGRGGRLHDRFRYAREEHAEGSRGTWRVERLAP